ncbi:hypothetical protein QWY86_05710 [Pedobacter aquatilis]|uniref:relaxase/mobilization nuclease domain-containing protein n=1 Tax=Pedobacter aquatilis TaxID=351343 RepID=UPI0025B4199D|nr:hypothetical protein [Pedobacter aquatilis]MDN3586152.1 hypothetical protein [Pedobacter aquatilis]
MDKVRRGDAELLVYKNFGILHAFSNPLAADFEHYFGAVSSLSRQSWYAQFHAVLSVKGKAIPADNLKRFAEQWLGEMGYGAQPFMIFFHSDTKNNHVHIVSSSILFSGRKISASFERRRAVEAINKLLGIDLEVAFKNEIIPLLEYNFSSFHQFTVLLKRIGYQAYTGGNQFIIRKYGRIFLKISQEQLTKMILRPEVNSSGSERIRLLINNSLITVDNRCIPMYQQLAHNFAGRLTGFHSALSDYLLRQYSLEILYHFKNRIITGFSVIDHKARDVFDGGVVMELSRLIGENPQRLQVKSYSR